MWRVMRRYTALALAFAPGLALGALLMVLLRGGEASLPIVPPADGEGMRVNMMAEYHRPLEEVVRRYSEVLEATPTVEYPYFSISGDVDGLRIQVRGMYTEGKTVVHMWAGR